MIVASLLFVLGAGQSSSVGAVDVADDDVVTGDAIREIALSYLGRPYVSGGDGDPGFDCSGFVCRVYGEAGRPLPRVSRDQARVGTPVDRSGLEVGDVVFFADDGEEISHVGIYIGDGAIVHASTGQGRVVVDSLDTSWFADRWVVARRVIGRPSSTSTSTTARFFEIAGRELERKEHVGAHALLPMLRLPAKHAEPSFVFSRYGEPTTSIGVVGAFATEAGVWGATLMPEAALRIDSIALAILLAVPVRFEIGKDPSLGTFERVADYFAFVRRVSLGLRGADLELALSRSDDRTLLSGFLVRHFEPSVGATGLPELSIAPTPLSFFGAVRTSAVETQAIVDDVLDPRVLAAGVAVPLGASPATFDVGIASDLRTGANGDRGTLSAGELGLALDLAKTERWSVATRADAALVHAIDRLGLGARASLSIEHRFRRIEIDHIALDVGLGYAGAHFLEAPFSTVYPLSRDAHLFAIDHVGGRALGSALLSLRVAFVHATAAYFEGFGGDRQPLDRRVEALLEIADIPFGGTRVFDLRAGWIARGVFDSAIDDAPSMLHAMARFRATRWFELEVFVREANAIEGGVALNVSYRP